MFFKCLLLFFIMGDINAQFGQSGTCPYPRFEHGRFRMRQKSKLVKFVCFPGYTLVGNKYSTCRNGEWDVPAPVCVRPGCQLPQVENGIAMVTHGDAWAVFFCFPRHNLIGSSALYCDGRRWNASIPRCEDSSIPSPLSCDFEDPHICGWTQDELHDFDWSRHNKKTPSSFLFTGPSFDHTYGSNGSGHYMYIESTSRLENDTARLVSPIFDVGLTKNGCFSFFYHMYGKTTGGLRVYQKPEHLALPALLQMSDAEKHKYILFDQWGNQGDAWYSAVAMLSEATEDFQIVIEGIRGSSYTSDIAIDDVAILQGDNCTAARISATTPVSVMPDSCSGRCNVYGHGTAPEDLGCGCTAVCAANGDCCPDFFDLCVFGPSTTQDESSPAEYPQTQKLVAPRTDPITTSTTTTSTTTTSTTTTTPFTTTSTTTTQKPTTRVASTTKIVETPKIVLIKSTTSIKPTSTPKTTTKMLRTTTPKVIKTTKVPATAKVVRTTTESVKKVMEDRRKQEKERKVEVKKILSADSRNKSSGGKTAVLTIVLLLGCAGLVWLAAVSRTTRGREAIARLRGRTARDPDVRYLTSHVDDD